MAGRSDRGSGTVLVVGAVAVLLTLTVASLTVVSAVVAGHRAQSAADLAALAAASALGRGAGEAPACATAAVLARRNGGTLAECTTGANSDVELVVRLAPTMPGLGRATARARAGPGAAAAP
jgi:secretion/DNA translocation related TadE-like protein